MDSPENKLRVTVFTAIAAETSAMLDQLESFDSYFIRDSLAHTGALKETCSPCDVTVIELGPGNIETAMEAGRVRGDGSTDILLFVGIAGSLKDLAIGDVVAAHEVLWLHRARAANGEIQYRPQLSPCTRELVQVARYTAHQGCWQNRITAPLKNPPKALVGQILSGEELIKDKNYKTILRGRYSDAVAVDNEGYGLARAGTASLKVLVVRSASDHADETKSDSDQATAARSAAAFAAQLLSDYLALIKKAAPPMSTPAPAPATNPMSPNPIESTTGYDRAATAIEALREDIDLVGDDQHAVEEFAGTDFAAADQSLRTALVELLANELDDETDTLVARRLRWYGRAFASDLVASGAVINWDEIIKRSPVGGAILLSKPDAFRVLGERERRRVLSGIIGHAEKQKVPSAIGWHFLIPLLRAEVLTESEAARVREAQIRTPYPVLDQAGFTLQELTPILIEDLESGNFHFQNAAARRLLASDNLGMDDSSLSVEERGRLAYLLMKAASGGAWDAQKICTRSRMADWPADVLASMLWTCLTRGTSRLDAYSIELTDIIAAATLGGKLDEVLSSIEQSDHIKTLSPISNVSADEDRRWLSHYAGKLPGEAQFRWDLFLTRLFKVIPRKLPNLPAPTSALRAGSGLRSNPRS